MNRRGAGVAGGIRSNPTLTLTILACATLTYAISQTSVIPALPSIQAEYSATAAATGWVMSAFFITSAVFTGVMGRLGDIFGKKRMLVVTLALYGAGSILSAAAGSLLVLVIGRMIMGSGGGMVPLAYAIARDELPAARVSVGMGTIAMTIGLGAGIGMVGGGLVTQLFGFHWNFLIAAILSGAALTAVLSRVPESSIRSPARIDWVGAGLLCIGLGLFLFAVSRANVWGWLSVEMVVTAALGLLFLFLLIVVENRRVQPLIHVPTLRRRPVLYTNIATSLMGAGQVAASVLIVQFAQVPPAGGGIGSGPAEAGLFLVPYSILMVAGAQFAGRIAWKWGGRGLMVRGAAIAATGIGLIATVPVQPAFLIVLGGIAGFGISMTMVASPFILAKVVDPIRMAEANGTNTIARNVGQGVGVQVTATVMAAYVIAGTNLPSTEGFQLAFLLSGLVCAGALFSALRLPRRKDSTGVASVEVATGVDAQGLARRAVAASEGENLVSDVVAARRATEDG